MDHGGHAEAGRVGEQVRRQWRATLGCVFTTGDCERRESVRRQNAAASQAQSVEHPKAASSLTRLWTDEPTPAFCRVVELGAGSEYATESRHTTADVAADTGRVAMITAEADLKVRLCDLGKRIPPPALHVVMMPFGVTLAVFQRLFRFVDPVADRSDNDNHDEHNPGDNQCQRHVRAPSNVR
jgi:hypothetical protein